MKPADSGSEQPGASKPSVHCMHCVSTVVNAVELPIGLECRVLKPWGFQPFQAQSCEQLASLCKPHVEFRDALKTSFFLHLLAFLCVCTSNGWPPISHGFRNARPPSSRASPTPPASTAVAQNPSSHNVCSMSFLRPDSAAMLRFKAILPAQPIPNLAAIKPSYNLGYWLSCPNRDASSRRII